MKSDCLLIIAREENGENRVKTWRVTQLKGNLKSSVIFVQGGYLYMQKTAKITSSLHGCLNCHAARRLNKRGYSPSWTRLLSPQPLYDDSLLGGVEKCPQKVPKGSELHNIQQLVLLLDLPLHSGLLWQLFFKDYLEEISLCQGMRWKGDILGCRVRCEECFLMH